MTSFNDILNLIILLGAVQGFICSGILFFQRSGNPTSNRLLATLLLLISLACLNIYLMESGIKHRFPVAMMLSYFVPLLITMPIGPLIYFYTRSFLKPDFRLSPRHKLHFLTTLVDLIPYIAGGLFILFHLDQGSEKNTWIDFIDLANMYIDIPRWGSITLYLIFSAVFFARENSNHNVPLKWIRQFLIVFTIFQLLWLLHLIPYLIPATSPVLLTVVKWYPVYVPLAILIYWLGFNGFINHKRTERVNQQRNAPKLSEELVERIVLKLESAMCKDRLFLNPTLTVEVLARHTSIPQKQISGVLNQHMGKSFNEFVNQYRVEELKKRLVEPGNEYLTITGIAMECGFNSQASLQRIFKQMTNVSPKEYKLAALGVPPADASKERSNPDLSIK